MADESRGTAKIDPGQKMMKKQRAPALGHKLNSNLPGVALDSRMQMHPAAPQPVLPLPTWGSENLTWYSWFIWAWHATYAS